jgi:hypothetical protein
MKMINQKRFDTLEEAKTFRDTILKDAVVDGSSKNME